MSKTIHANRRSGRHSRHSKQRGAISHIFTWLKRNPMKLIGILFMAILIYITILFVLFDKEQKVTKFNPYLKNPGVIFKYVSQTGRALRSFTATIVKIAERNNEAAIKIYEALKPPVVPFK